MTDGILWLDGSVKRAPAIDAWLDAQPADAAGGLPKSAYLTLRLFEPARRIATACTSPGTRVGRPRVGGNECT